MLIDIEAMSLQQVTLLVVAILIFISFMTGIISLILETDRTRQWYGDWFQGVSTEMVGAAVTTIFFTFIVGAVEQKEATLALQSNLIKQMGSVVNGEALRAVEELRDNGWLRDGTLQEQDFYSANLTNGQLFGADLTGAILFDASFENANLEGAGLTNANLQGANLANANLKTANLQNADLNAANLKGVDLSNADLRGANLANANLMGATLTNTHFDKNTKLPDALFDDEHGRHIANWQPDINMKRFTDTNHPNFWQPQAPYPWWFDSP